MPRNSFAKTMDKYKDKKVVLICARYQYWGTVAEIGEDHLVMSTPTAVEQSGRATGTAPASVDPIPESIVIKFDAIEILYRPAWVENKPPHEVEAEKKK